MKKYKLQFWLAGCLSFLLVSCFGDNDTELNDWELSNCQIASFALANDSIPGLADVKFTIDQVNGLIYNKDSMPYGTVINEKVVCTINYEVPPSMVEILQVAIGDTHYDNWNGTDSVDFSDVVRFTIYSYNGKASKVYESKLNVHRQNPDSMTWTLTADKLLGKYYSEQKVILRNGYYLMYVKTTTGYELYRSPETDLKTWTSVPLTGLLKNSPLLAPRAVYETTLRLDQMAEYENILYLPDSDGVLYCSGNGRDWTVVEKAPFVKSLLGVLDATTQLKHPSALTAIILNVTDGGEFLFASMDTAMNWKTGVAVPPEFPVFGFGTVGYESMYYQHLVAVAGVGMFGQLSNAAWETMDGLSWVRLTSDSTFEKREGAMVTKYDDKLFLIGGINEMNKATSDIYRSENYGLTWSLADTLIILPETYKARGYASVVVDKDKFLHLFGGKENTDSPVLDQLWSGRLNRLGFKE
ncbi:MAG: DUF6242 domain-containing protein [Tannerella sp.]|jgi:hypothetical protein|nr:DUF6242 domain-containing protein [Tannerella sp.]